MSNDEDAALLRWYECERKVPHLTESGAESLPTTRGDATPSRRTRPTSTGATTATGTTSVEVRLAPVGEVLRNAIGYAG